MIVSLPLFASTNQKDLLDSNRIFLRLRGECSTENFFANYSAVCTCKPKIPVLETQSEESISRAEKEYARIKSIQDGLYAQGYPSTQIYEILKKEQASYLQKYFPDYSPPKKDGHLLYSSEYNNDSDDEYKSLEIKSHEIELNCFHSVYTIEANQTWEHARYLAEMHYQCFTEKAGLRGYFWEPSKTIKEMRELQDDETIQAGTCIVLVREPLRPNEFNYTPIYFQKINHAKYVASLPKEVPILGKIKNPYYKYQKTWQEMTEDEKMEALATHSIRGDMLTPEQHNQEEIEVVLYIENKYPEFSFSGPKQHPFAFRKQRENEKNIEPIPHGYICNRCRNPGHWKVDCPTWLDPSWEPVGGVQRALGIPSKWLQKIDYKDIYDFSKVMKNLDGDFVVLLPEYQGMNPNNLNTSPKKEMDAPRSFVPPPKPRSNGFVPPPKPNGNTNGNSNGFVPPPRPNSNFSTHSTHSNNSNYSQYSANPKRSANSEKMQSYGPPNPKKSRHY